MNEHHPVKNNKMIWEDFKDLKKLWPYLREHKKLITVAAGLIPVISLLQMALPLTLKYAIDGGILRSDFRVLLMAALIYLIAVLGEYASRAGQALTTALAVHRMIRNLRLKLIGHVLNLDCTYHDRALSGALVTRATSDFDNLSESLNQGVLTSVVDLAVLVGCLVGMFLLNWKLALCALVILPLVAWIVRWFSVALKSAMMKARRKIAVLNAYTQECLYGNSTIKLLAGEARAQSKFDRMNVEYRNAQMTSVILDAFMFSVLDGIAAITMGLVLWLGLSQIVGDAAISAGIMVAFAQFVQQLFEPLKHLGNKMAMLQGAFTALDRIFAVLETERKISGNQPVGSLAGHIEFDHVTFSYGEPGEDHPPILYDLSFELRSGQSLAIVGATGSGKSTIVKLIAKLYDGYDGTIRIDGQDLRTLDPVELRRQIAMVPQDIALFDGTVAFNISLGLPGISREAIEQAARDVGADEFIRRLDGGYDHQIREQGANLSHGQRQLIAFARALVRDPGVVILDEATSSVDPESEAVIQSAIARILKGRTVIVIAHRLSTIRQCSRILVIDRGRIVEGGCHEELIAARSAYFRLHSALA